MASSSRLSARVLHRHRHSAVVLRDLAPTRIDVVYSEGGIVSAQDLARLLADRLGVLVRVRFRPSLSGTPSTIA
jgi:hypothetical protein